jgi:hypothetical protein
LGARRANGWSNRRWRKLHPKRLHHAQDGAEARIAIRNEGFIERIPRDPGALGHRGYAARAGDGANGRGYHARIAIFECRFKVREVVFGALDIIGQSIWRFRSSC